MNGSQFRHFKLFTALAVVMLLFVEFICFSVYKLNPAEMFDWRYYESAMDHTNKTDLPFGWSSPEGLPRPDQAEHLYTCARAFGDSFTYGEEVSQKDVWTALASQELGCRIENYGVGGFGTDQAYLLYKSTKTNTPIVILGIYTEMLRRNLAASWLFYGGQKDRALKPYFKLNKHDQLVQIPWPTDSTRKDLIDYHRHDAFFQSYHIRFPYSWHILKSIFFQLKTRLENKRIVFNKHAYDLPLQLTLLDAFTAQASLRDSVLVLVFFPSLSDLANNDLAYAKQLHAYTKKYPDICVIDTGPALLSATKGGAMLGAPAGHFNPLGNKIVADEVVRELQACSNTRPRIKQ